MTKTTGMIFDIKRYAIHDGPGIRTAVFLKGCPLKCWWCHNPEGQDGQPQLMFRANRCNGTRLCIPACPQGAIQWNNGSITDWAACDNCGICAEVCYAGAREMVGRSISVGDLMTELLRDRLFYDQSGGGVTFTGGEPMFQRGFLREALLECRRQSIHTCVDTCGYASWGGFEQIHPLVDLFLYDIKIMDESRHKTYTSVSNRLILDNLRRLTQIGAHIIVRLPIIPGVNDGKHDLEQVASYLAGLAGLEGVQCMPYHDIGLAKYQSLGMEYRLTGTPILAKEQIMLAEQTLSSYQLPVVSHFPQEG